MHTFSGGLLFYKKNVLLNSQRFHCDTKKGRNHHTYSWVKVDTGIDFMDKSS
jgi:hypothetical protein